MEYRNLGNSGLKISTISLGTNNFGGRTDMAKGDVMFAATGVTSGSMLKGVRRFHNGAETHSIVMRSKSGTIREVASEHRLDKLGRYAVIDYSGDER